MTLSDGEKLIALMLADLHEHLEIDGELDAGFVKSAIFNDHLWSIPFKYSGLDFENSELPEEVSEVLNIMDMWRFIEFHYSQLSDANKSEVARLANPFGDNPQFAGFDGNNETEHMSIAQCVIEDLDRFNEFQDRNLNSHAPSLDGYRRMLPVFDAVRSANLYNDSIGVEEIVSILIERVHPSNRN
ncbi:YfbU family protein [Vibrio atlanticus]|uniref:YfbU family protein n=1 Tax=Vibrio atlanticus TaxID=693153 RepID=UPI0035539DAE